jgi:hypothetical protein
MHVREPTYDYLNIHQTESRLSPGFLQDAGTDLFSLCSFLLVLLDFVQGCQEKAKRVSCCRVKLPIMINDVNNQI